MVATNVDLTDIDYLMELWQQGQSMSEGSVGNVGIQSCTAEHFEKSFKTFSYICNFLRLAL